MYQLFRCYNLYPEGVHERTSQVLIQNNEPRFYQIALIALTSIVSNYLQNICVSKRDTHRTPSVPRLRNAAASCKNIAQGDHTWDKALRWSHAFRSLSSSHYHQLPTQEVALWGHFLSPRPPLSFPHRGT